MDVTIIRRDLGNDCCNCIVRSISFNNNGIIGVEMRQDRGLSKGLFKCVECLGVVGTPDEWGILVGEVNQGDDDVREPHNESAIKVGETQECLDCLEVSRGQSDANHISLGYIYRDASGGDYKA